MNTAREIVMTLEKLLILGFALAVSVALTTIATNTADRRVPDNNAYEARVDRMVQQTGAGR